MNVVGPDQHNLLAGPLVLSYRWVKSLVLQMTCFRPQAKRYRLQSGMIPAFPLSLGTFSTSRMLGLSAKKVPQRRTTNIIFGDPNWAFHFL